MHIDHYLSSIGLSQEYMPRVSLPIIFMTQLAGVQDAGSELSINQLLSAPAAPSDFSLAAHSSALAVLAPYLHANEMFNYYVIKIGLKYLHSTQSIVLLPWLVVDSRGQRVEFSSTSERMSERSWLIESSVPASWTPASCVMKMTRQTNARHVFLTQMPTKKDSGQVHSELLSTYERR